MSALDAALDALSGELGRTRATLTAECSTQRVLAIQDYSAGENQVTTAALEPLASVSAAWKAGGDAFVADVGQAAADAATRHGQATRTLESTIRKLVVDTIDYERNPKRRARDSLRASGRGMIRGARNFGIGVATFVGVNMIGGPFGAALLAAYSVFESVHKRIEQLESTWESRGTFGKIEGIFESTAAVAADQFGVTSILEGLTQHEAVTHRHLGAEEAAAKASEGLLAAVTARVIEHVVAPSQGANGSPAGARTSPGTGPGVEGPPAPKRVLEVFTGDGLASARDLARQHPDSRVVAAEARYPPSADDIARFRAEGGEFLAERFAESLPPSSVEKIYVRYPMPHEKGVENNKVITPGQVREAMDRSPGISPREATDRIAQSRGSEVESMTNLGPHALEKLVPGGTIELVFWERSILDEVRALTGRLYLDPVTGQKYSMRVMEGPISVPRASLPHSGRGIPSAVETVSQLTMQKVVQQ